MLKTYQPLVEAYMETLECDAEEAAWRIEQDSPEERLKMYCEWNGIIGYTHILFKIATGSAS